MNEGQSMPMTFGYAIAALKAGKKVTRWGWNGKGMFLIYVSASEWNSQNDWLVAGTVKRPFILMKTVDHEVVPWVASQTDMLAEDWMIVVEGTECDS